ncbi:GAF and ANTAR domain-containing protein [Kytococcus sedentarius]|uniref:GAF and ANTAR domain-containing protein n=1 Tax=Kytococcus sedentarius TaxID=1276 RepID=UPI0035BC362A
MPHSDSDDLAVRLARSASAFATPDTLEGVAQAICEEARGYVPDADAASVSLLLTGGRIETVAATSPECLQVDRYQEEHREGPCASAVREAEVTHLQDTATDREWPRFSAWAAEHGVGSMMAIQLQTFEADETHPQLGRAGIGALNFFSPTAHAFDEDAERVAGLLAVHASLALGATQLRDQLTAAVDSRDLIGQAKGILMSRLGIDDEAAFGVLRDRSRNTNVRLVEVARSVVEGPTTT